MEKVRIYCKNTEDYYLVNPGTTLMAFLKEINPKTEYPVLAAMVDNQLKELSFNIYMAHSIEFITIAHADGRRTYVRSLSFVLQRAVSDLYPDYQLILDYTLPNGLYGEIVTVPDRKTILLSNEEITKLKEKMAEIIAADFPIIKVKMNNEEAVALFSSHNQHDKAGLFKDLGHFFVSVYFLCGYGDTFYGPQLYSTGAIDRFDLIKYNGGFCLQSPSNQWPYTITNVPYQEKLFDVFKENSNWCNILGVKDIVTINKAITSGYAPQVIQVAEALHERKYTAIADKIKERSSRVKLVLIAGPSSSGKTTTSKRIALQLKVIGLNPVVIAMDNYFVNREDTPLDEHGNLDFECLEAMDLAFLNKQLNQLFNGEEVELPTFDFALGKRYFSGQKTKMKPNDILIMEGIHALNPNLTSGIDNELKYKIYASALTSLSIDENNSISTTDNRLLRRMVRDNNFRGTSAEQTILRWPSVRNGEYKNIFPYQENADIMFNSSLIYELPMLKHYAEPLLRRITPLSPAYAESLRLLKFLSYIVELNPKEQAGVPPTSVMREFIGGSTLEY
ncbi:MAG: nucleoside kinase [Bacteroidales bacterium]